jgi:hypothetical protein
VKYPLFAALLLPAAAWAQSSLPDPTLATEDVPAVQYRSVFADTPTGVERESLDWKKANDEVGQFRRGHLDILKWEAEQARIHREPPLSPAGQPTRGGKP